MSTNTETAAPEIAAELARLEREVWSAERIETEVRGRLGQKAYRRSPVTSPQPETRHSEPLAEQLNIQVGRLLRMNERMRALVSEI